MRYYNEEESIEDTIEGCIWCPLIIIGLIVAFIIVPYQSCQEQKESDTLKYEIVVLDKYSDMGSNFHIIGGRATETEYHIKYKYRICPSDDWRYETVTVDGFRYKELSIGSTYYFNNKYGLIAQ